MERVDWGGVDDDTVGGAAVALAKGTFSAETGGVHISVHAAIALSPSVFSYAHKWNTRSHTHTHNIYI